MAAAGQSHNSTPKRIIAAYDYVDGDGKLLYQVLRYEPKNFCQRRPDGKGKWIWNLEDRRILYRWPELLKFPDATVFVTEGEKDADNVAALNLCATCVATGKWTPECIAALAGREVVILEDNDDAGRTKALAAAQTLHGTAKTIRIVSLPDLPDKGDVSDWLEADPNNAKKFTKTCFDVPVWVPSEADAKIEAAPSESKSSTNAPPLPFINIAAWHDQPVPERTWTVKDRIPASNVTLLSGEGSIGKIYFVVAACHCHSTWSRLAWAHCQSRDQHSSCAARTTPTNYGGVSTRSLKHYSAAFTEFQDIRLMALAGRGNLDGGAGPSWPHTAYQTVRTHS